MKKHILSVLSLVMTLWGYTQDQKVSGIIEAASTGEPMVGVTIWVKGTSNGTITAVDGTFSLTAPSATDTLVCSYLGFQTTEIPIQSQTYIQVKLEELTEALDEVAVYATGYQQIPRERATGSFEQVDNELLNRSVGTNVIHRLEAVVPGLIFNRNGNLGSTEDISIRGLSTINANSQPLIILDNFPYEGALNSINPNDIEHITILKDASATSIWGAKAANGVIVITTKQGSYHQKLKVTLNTNLTIGEIPDLYYIPRMNSADYIDIEERLFNEGYYQGTENSPYHTPLSPAVELFIARRDGLIAEDAAQELLTQMKARDVRKDYEKYLYQNPIYQQYSLNLQGGSDKHRYFMSVGYDHNRMSLVENSNERLTLNTMQHYKLTNKLVLSTGVNYIHAMETENNPGTGSLGINNNPLYPYAALADELDNPLATIKGFRPDFLAQSAQDGLLNWEYYPLEEVKNADNTNRGNTYRLNAALAYTLLPGLSLKTSYQYTRDLYAQRQHHSTNTYFARDLINRFTQVLPDGSLSHPVPVGGILDMQESSATQHNWRNQLTLDKEWSGVHRINAIGGMDLNDRHTTSNQYRQYGYDSQHGTHEMVDYFSYFPQYYYPAANSLIPYIDGQTDLTDRFLSWYGNVGYTFDARYTITGSARLDQSNLFGVKTNQKGVPLWSMGVAWNASNESFYPLTWLPELKVRATYGYSGNVDKTLSAYTTARYYGGIYNDSGQPYATVLNPPNPDLRWERTRMLNLGIDFASQESVISGSIEYYTKHSSDLIGTSPIAPSTGITSFTGNTANMKGKGVDISLATTNINRAIKWTSNWLFSYNTNKVTRHKTEANVRSYLQYIQYPREDYPLYAIYSYPWAGLDPETGDPMGYVEGEPSKDYLSIYINANTDSLIYNGPARPTMFGAWRNTVSFRNWSLSWNISYQLGYYFRRNSVSYGNTYGLGGGFGDYNKRWQNPGDEKHTQVPSLPESGNYFRDEFYTYSDVLIERGDHIRLQDVRLSYTLQSKGKWLPDGTMMLYLYANNLGVIWKKTDAYVDPGFINYRPQRSIALGAKIDF